MRNTMPVVNTNSNGTIGGDDGDVGTSCKNSVGVSARFGFSSFGAATFPGASRPA